MDEIIKNMANVGATLFLKAPWEVAKAIARLGK